eukprot:4880100-Prorocentrum_lima.AAC.1
MSSSSTPRPMRARRRRSVASPAHPSTGSDGPLKPKAWSTNSPPGLLALASGSPPYSTEKLYGPCY